MNRNLIVTLIALVAAAALFFGYRAYKLSAERDLAQERAAAELALARQRQGELARRTAAVNEARRMAEARAQEEMKRLEKIREEQEAAQAALAAADAEVARLAALKKMHDLDEEKRQIADRAAARDAALRRQMALEAEAERLAWEQALNAYRVGGYLVRDIKSLYILRAAPPPEPPANPSGPAPSK